MAMKRNEIDTSRMDERLRRARLSLLAVVLALLSGWEVGRLVAGAAGRTSAAEAVSAQRRVMEVLAHCDRHLARARARMAGRDGRGHAALRVATLELCRSRSLLLLEYEKMQARRAGAAGMSAAEYRQWGERYLRTDPEGTLTRAAAAARAALKSELDPSARRIALLALARAYNGLGNYRAETEALAQAAHLSPNDAPLWERLARAYALTRQFVRAEAAMTRALEVADAERSAR